MSNIKEGYAFIIKTNYEKYIKEKRPYSTSVGSNYKLISFAKVDEHALTTAAAARGLICAHLTAQDTITSMEALENGPFIVYGEDAHSVVNYFNPPKS